MFSYLQKKIEQASENVNKSNSENSNTEGYSTASFTGESGMSSDENKRTNNEAGGSGDVSRSFNNMESLDIFFGGYERLSMGERREELANTICRIVRAIKRTGKYISAVYYTAGAEEDSIVRELIRSHATNSVFKWFIKHEDHYHIVHDCTYSSGCCRCFNKYKFPRRLRRLISISSLTPEDYKLLINYHFKEGRRVEVLEIRGVDYSKLFHRLEVLQDGGNTTGENRDTGDVEICVPEDKVLRDIYERQYDNEDVESVDFQFSEDSGKTGSRSRKRRATETEKSQEKLEKLILAISKVPLHDFVTTEEFINSSWRFLNTMNAMFKNAINTVKLKFYTMRLRDYRRHYEMLTTLPYWDTSTREEFDNKYLSLQVSKRFVLKLLIWQYAPESMDDKFQVINDEWKKYVFAYLQDLIMLLDKRRHKRNTDVYVSPPNAGKTLFMDLIRDYFINCGQMLNWNRNSSFPLQTCGFTRVIFWNEPNYESSVERNLLKLLGGDSLNASIKNQMDVNITKTPIFVTSNTYPFPKSKEFEYRIKSYIWKSADFLKHINGKKFHPLTFQYLINETENYYQDDITEYLTKYGSDSLENNFLSSIDLDLVAHCISDNDSDCNDDKE